MQIQRKGINNTIGSAYARPYTLARAIFPTTDKRGVLKYTQTQGSPYRNPWKNFPAAVKHHRATGAPLVLIFFWGGVHFNKVGSREKHEKFYTSVKHFGRICVFRAFYL